jgi:hypothetical protein
MVIKLKFVTSLLKSFFNISPQKKVEDKRPREYKKKKNVYFAKNPSSNFSTTMYFFLLRSKTTHLCTLKYQASITKQLSETSINTIQRSYQKFFSYYVTKKYLWAKTWGEKG